MYDHTQIRPRVGKNGSLSIQAVLAMHQLHSDETGADIQESFLTCCIPQPGDIPERKEDHFHQSLSTVINPQCGVGSGEAVVQSRGGVILPTLKERGFRGNLCFGY